MILYYKNKKINVVVKKVGFFGKVSGLTFRKKNTKSILFEFKSPTKTAIHSYFVFFDFLAIWADKKNRIIEYKIVKPFTISIKPRRQFQKLIEIPLNNRNRKVVKTIVGKV